jgi:hypothetical protein
MPARSAATASDGDVDSAAPAVRGSGRGHGQRGAYRARKRDGSRGGRVRVVGGGGGGRGRGASLGPPPSSSSSSSAAAAVASLAPSDPLEALAEALPAPPRPPQTCWTVLASFDEGTLGLGLSPAQRHAPKPPLTAAAASPPAVRRRGSASLAAVDPASAAASAPAFPAPPLLRRAERQLDGVLASMRVVGLPPAAVPAQQLPGAAAASAAVQEEGGPCTLPPFPPPSAFHSTGHLARAVMAVPEARASPTVTTASDFFAWAAARGLSASAAAYLAGVADEDFQKWCAGAGAAGGRGRGSASSSASSSTSLTTSSLLSAARSARAHVAGSLQRALQSHKEAHPDAAPLAADAQEALTSSFAAQLRLRTVLIPRAAIPAAELAAVVSPAFAGLLQAGSSHRGAERSAASASTAAEAEAPLVPRLAPEGLDASAVPPGMLPIQVPDEAWKAHERLTGVGPALARLMEEDEAMAAWEQDGDGERDAEMGAGGAAASSSSTSSSSASARAAPAPIPSIVGYDAWGQPFIREEGGGGVRLARFASASHPSLALADDDDPTRGPLNAADAELHVRAAYARLAQVVDGVSPLPAQQGPATGAAAAAAGPPPPPSAEAAAAASSAGGAASATSAAPATSASFSSLSSAAPADPAALPIRRKPGRPRTRPIQEPKAPRNLAAGDATPGGLALPAPPSALLPAVGKEARRVLDLLGHKGAAGSSSKYVSTLVLRVLGPEPGDEAPMEAAVEPPPETAADGGGGGEDDEEEGALDLEGTAAAALAPSRGRGRGRGRGQGGGGRGGARRGRGGVGPRAASSRRASVIGHLRVATLDREAPLGREMEDNDGDEGGEEEEEEPEGGGAGGGTGSGRRRSTILSATSIACLGASGPARGFMAYSAVEEEVRRSFAALCSAAVVGGDVRGGARAPSLPLVPPPLQLARLTAVVFELVASIAACYDAELAPGRKGAAAAGGGPLQLQPAPSVRDAASASLHRPLPFDRTSGTGPLWVHRRLLWDLLLDALVAFEGALARAAAACFESVRAVAGALVRWAGASAVGALLRLGPATASFSGAQGAMKGLQNHLSVVREVQGAMEGLQAVAWRLGAVAEGAKGRGGSALDAPGRATGPDDCLRAVEVLLARSPAPLRRV